MGARPPRRYLPGVDTQAPEPEPGPGAGSSLASLELGPLVLRVRDLAAMRRFYTDVIGLEAVSSSSGVEVLGSDGRALVELREAPGAQPRPAGTSGLFHLAILEPDRAALAGTLRRLLDAGAPLAGASDHIVSEALYLDDPEGNGIEIYRDRPRDQWRWTDGEVAMATLPLDLSALLAEADATVRPAAGRSLGHVHMNVGDLETARRFYTGVLGLDVTQGSYPGALFVSAGGYHHDFGLNVWEGEGAPPPPAGSLGLAGVTVRVPADAELAEIEARAAGAGVPARREEGALVVADPFGVELRLVAG